MNISGISDQTLFGRLLRFPLGCIPKDLQMPILQGKLRWKKWIVGAGNHGCWLGTYEYEKTRVFEKVIRPGDVVFDIGAHAGFYTLLASELVGETGRVFAYEPLMRNLRYLRRHLEINQVTNVTVIEAAVSDSSGIVTFQEGNDSYTGHISSSGVSSVRSVTLDELAMQGEVPFPDSIKIDVEGSEMLVLTGARKILERSKPVLFLSTHGNEAHRNCSAYLKSLGYSLEPVVGSNVDSTDELLAKKS